jgi:hypothetical protein
MRQRIAAMSPRQRVRVRQSQAAQQREQRADADARVPLRVARPPARRSNDDGQVNFTVRVVGEDGKQVRRLPSAARAPGCRRRVPTAACRMGAAAGGAPPATRPWRPRPRPLRPPHARRPPPPPAPPRRPQLTDGEVAEVHDLIDRLVSTTSMSTRPAIYGMIAERELQRLTRCAGPLGGARGRGRALGRG